MNATMNTSISYDQLNSPLTTFERFFVGLGVLGVVLNLLVILVFSLYGHLLSGTSATARLLILHQSVLDTVASAFLVVIQFYGGLGSRGPVIPASITSGQWVYCRVLWSTHITWTFMCASTFNLEVLTIERYLSIIHPVWHRNNVVGKNKGKLLIICILMWILGFLDPLANLCLSAIYIPEKHECAMVGLGFPTDQITVIITLVSNLFVIPLLIMGYCYGRILYRVFRTTTVGDSSGGQNNAATVRNKRLAQTCALIALVYVICYAPDMVYFCQYIFGGPLDPTWYSLVVALNFTNCMWNPLIYTWKMPEFRKGVGKLLLAGAVRLGAVEGEVHSGRSRPTGGSVAHKEQRNVPDSTANDDMEAR